MAPLPRSYYESTMAQEQEQEQEPLLDEKKETIVQVSEETRDSIDSTSSDQDVEFFEQSSRNVSPFRRLLSFFLLFLLVKLYLFNFGFHLPSLPDSINPLWSMSFGRPCPHKLQRIQDHQHAINYLDYLKDQNSIQWSNEDQQVDVGGPRLKSSNPWEEVQRKVEEAFLQIPSADSAREALKRYTTKPHYAGTPQDYAVSHRLLSEWGNHLGVKLPSNLSDLVFDAGSSDSIKYMTGNGFRDDDITRFHPRVWTDTYSVWLNWPIQDKPNSLKVHNKKGELQWQAKLKEDSFNGTEGVPIFHGYSQSGTVFGPLIYANKGRREDFASLKSSGIDPKGTIALVRYGGNFRGLKVRAAQEAGCVGILIYSDPAEDTGMTEANGFTAYPDGPARNPSSVQRGSVQALSFYPGDPSTPRKPSYRNATRLSEDEADSLARIPSLPLSWKDAQGLLERIQDKGIQVEKINKDWNGEVPDVTYWTGEGLKGDDEGQEILTLENNMEMKTRDIWNSYLFIPGVVEREKVVVLGNHVDAWTYGAGDPNSGTAAVHEIVKGLGSLYKRGWRPPRSILIAAWDAEEYGLVGSTEMGEDYAEWIKEHVIAYHNVDVAVSGSYLEAGASPSLKSLIYQSSHEILDPSKDDNSTLNLKPHSIKALGSGSDFTVFLQYLGVASSNIGYSRSIDPKDNDPVYHYHSNYDNFDWMDRFGDVGFKRHETVAKLLGVILLRSVSAAIAPIDTIRYALALEEYFGKVGDVIEKFKFQKSTAQEEKLESLKKSIKKVKNSSKRLEVFKMQIEKEINEFFEGHQSDDASVLDKSRLEKLIELLKYVREINQKSSKYESHFIDNEKGLPGREWYRNLIVAPGRWLGYGATTFPGITEAITLDAGEGLEEEISRLTSKLDELSESLKIQHGRHHHRHGHGDHGKGKGRGKGLKFWKGKHHHEHHHQH